MSEPLRTPSPSQEDGAHPVDPAAQIERLLLSGLDLYFSGQYQEAINVWTRVIFLERGHSRARAYIERARVAIAEQQREGDELLHRGRQAYEEGSLDAARALLTHAVDRGESSGDALSLLQRINRFAPGHGQDTTATPAGRAVSTRPVPESRRTLGWFVAALLVSAVALFAAPLASWWSTAPVEGTAAGVSTARPEPLPIVRTGEQALDSAHQLYASGRLADALRVLDVVDAGDPRRAEADRLRGDIQRDLLTTVRRDAVRQEVVKR